MDTTTERKIILLVEDELILANATAERIKQLGYEVIIATSGEWAGVQVTYNKGINLILMDITLIDGIDGIDGIEAAKEILKIRNVPIIFLTSHDEQEYVDKAKNITNYGYVIKSSDDFILKAAIESALELFETDQKTKYTMDILLKSEEQIRLLNEVDHVN